MVKGICSSKEFKFSAQHPSGDSQPHITPGAGRPAHFLDLHGHTHNLHTNRHIPKHINKNKS